MHAVQNDVFTIAIGYSLMQKNAFVRILRKSEKTDSKGVSINDTVYLFIQKELGYFTNIISSWSKTDIKMGKIF